MMADDQAAAVRCRSRVHAARSEPASNRAFTTPFGALVAAALAALSVACGPRAESAPPRDPGSPEVAPPYVELPTERPASAGRTPNVVASSVHVALGVPKDADDSDDWLLDREQFVVSYNARLNAPNWVAWHLDERDLGRSPRSPGFHSDSGLPKTFYVVRDEDYAGSGYDRGHLCPSADRTLTPAMNRATFVLSNAHPQFHELNAGPWEKLEMRERELARSGKELFVVAGGIFDADPKRIGKDRSPARRVAVPIASYKVIVVLEKGQGAEAVQRDTPVIAVIMPNEREAARHDFTDYETSIRAVERATGYDFLGRVPRDVQDAVETRSPR